MEAKRNENSVKEAPASRDPEAILADDSLTRSRKLDILLQWQAEAIHMQESDAEGFDGGERSHLDDINRILEKIQHGHA